jgi:hypothetical protein
MNLAHVAVGFVLAAQTVVVAQNDAPPPTIGLDGRALPRSAWRRNAVDAEEEIL